MKFPNLFVGNEFAKGTKIYYLQERFKDHLIDDTMYTTAFNEKKNVFEVGGLPKNRVGNRKTLMKVFTKIEFPGAGTKDGGGIPHEAPEGALRKNKIINQHDSTDET